MKGMKGNPVSISSLIVGRNYRFDHQNIFVNGIMLCAYRVTTLSFQYRPLFQHRKTNWNNQARNTTDIRHILDRGTQIYLPDHPMIHFQFTILYLHTFLSVA